MKVHLINPSSVSFGTAVITPRWQYVLAAATPKSFGDPLLVDEPLEQVHAAYTELGGGHVHGKIVLSTVMPADAPPRRR